LFRAFSGYETSSTYHDIILMKASQSFCNPTFSPLSINRSQISPYAS
jgi:hypothetical protein